MGELQMCTIEEPKKVKRIKIAIFIALIVILMLLAKITQNIIDNIKSYEVYKSYEAQLIELEKRQQEIAKEKEEERQKKLPKLTEQGKQNIESIYKSETKRAFLTFDDGPSQITSQVLDILKEKQVLATFFVLGSNVDARPEVVKRIYDEGHYIANHGYSHEYSLVYSSSQSVLEEFNRCNNSVQKAIGELEYNSHLFRFPGGFYGGKYADIKTEAKQLLLQNDIMSVDWNALTGDSEIVNPTEEYLLDRLRQTIQNKNSVVILMHDSNAKKVSAEILPQVIDELKNQGYEFKNFYSVIN